MMAVSDWGRDAPQATYQNGYDQGYDQGYGHGYAPAQRAEPALTASAAGAQYVHPAHGGPAPAPEFRAEMTPGADQPARGGFGAGMGAAVNYAGAGLSLALIVGLGVWGYQLAMRDVTGIPVVRALEGPMRVQPEDPGGQLAAHQGFAVNDVQSEGQATDAADRLVLAPGPEDLTEEDMVSEVSARADYSPAAALPLHEASVVMDNTVPVPADPVAAALAIAEQIAADATPLSGADAPTQVAALGAVPAVNLPSAAPTDAVKIIPASVPGVRRSPRPAGRPANLNTRVSAPVVQARAVVPEVSPDKVVAGTRLVQLGAYDSPDVARAEWDKLSARFEDYLNGKSRVIQKAQSGGKTFYRLRVMGFNDLSDARRFCSVLMAQKAACIPVVSR